MAPETPPLRPDNAQSQESGRRQGINPGDPAPLARATIGNLGDCGPHGMHCTTTNDTYYRRIGGSVVTVGIEEVLEPGDTSPPPRGVPHLGRGAPGVPGVQAEGACSLPPLVSRPPLFKTSPRVVPYVGRGGAVRAYAQILMYGDCAVLAYTSVQILLFGDCAVHA